MHVIAKSGISRQRTPTAVGWTLMKSSRHHGQDHGLILWRGLTQSTHPPVRALVFGMHTLDPTQGRGVLRTLFEHTCTPIKLDRRLGGRGVAALAPRRMTSQAQETILLCR